MRFQTPGLILLLILTLSAPAHSQIPTPPPQPDMGPGGKQAPHAAVTKNRYGQGGKEYWIESHAGAKSEQDHARQDVRRKASIDWCTGKEEQADSSEEQSCRKRRFDAESEDELRRKTDRQCAHDQVRGQERQANLEWAVSEH